LARLYFCCFLATHIFSAWAVFHHWVTTLLAFSIINHPPTWTNCLYSSSISPMIIAESIIYIRAVYIYSKYATQCYIYLVLYIFSFSLVRSASAVCDVRSLLCHCHCTLSFFYDETRVFDVMEQDGARRL
jgi:hypothetical protein